MPAVDDLRDNVARAHRILARAGLFAFSFGHVSARDGHGEDSVVLIVSALDGLRAELSDVTGDDIIAIDLEGDPLEEAAAPGERYLHTAIYKSRSDVGSVIHYHSSYTAAFGSAGIRVAPVSPLSASLALAVRVHPFGGLLTSHERGEALAATIGETAGAFLPGHGAVVVGRDVEEAVARVFALEEECKTQLLIRLLGGPSSDTRPHECIPDASVSSAIWQHLSRRDSGRPL